MSTRILIVDDEAAIFRSTSAVLAEFGYDVATCDWASEILRRVEETHPDLLLQDVRMPGLDLDRLVQQLRADPRWRDLPLVLFTASMEAEEVGQRVGAVAVLDKPFRPQHLTAAIDSALAGVA